MQWQCIITHRILITADDTSPDWESLIMQLCQNLCDEENNSIRIRLPFFWMPILLPLWTQVLHHPFTAPNPDDMNDLPSARALAYDIIYNGLEVLPVSPYYSLYTQILCWVFIFVLLCGPAFKTIKYFTLTLIHSKSKIQ